MFWNWKLLENVLSIPQVTVTQAWLNQIWLISFLLTNSEIFFPKNSKEIYVLLDFYDNFYLLSGTVTQEFESTDSWFKNKQLTKAFHLWQDLNKPNSNWPCQSSYIPDHQGHLDDFASRQDFLSFRSHFGKFPHLHVNSFASVPCEYILHHIWIIYMIFFSVQKCKIGIA